MWNTVQRIRDANGFLKNATVSIDTSLSLSTNFIYKLPNPTLVKAANTTLEEWSTKLVSNRIKVVAIAYNLNVQHVIADNSGSYPLSIPTRIDVLRITQSSAYQNETRIYGSDSYLLRRSIVNPSTLNNFIDSASMFTLPLEKESIGSPKIYDMNRKDESKTNTVLQFGANQVANSTYKPPIYDYFNVVPVDCFIDINDDGNVATTINLAKCLGEIPEVVYVTTYNKRNLSSPFALTHSAILHGQVTIVYQDIGTKLSHL